MVQAVLTAKGTIIPCQTSQKLHKSELVYCKYECNYTALILFEYVLEMYITC